MSRPKSCRMSDAASGVCGPKFGIRGDRMKESDRKKRNNDRLVELYPTFGARVEKVIADLETTGIRPRIQDAWRSPADQAIAFETHHAKVRFGFHNVTARDGGPEALAVDMLDDDHPLGPTKSYLLHLAASAQKAGLMTGIRWGVPKKLVGAIDTAIASQGWDADVKIGWDPTHIQPVGITIAQAKSGQRPT
jgi:hypothetical protein